MSFQKSTRVLKQDVLTICGELTDGTSPFDAQAVSYLDKVYQGLIAGNNLFDISCMEPWVWAQAKYPIPLTLSAKVTGTVTMTNASSIGGLSISPSISIEGRYISFEGHSDIYRISLHDGVQIQLDQVFLGSSGSYNYSAYKYDYEAVNDLIIVTSKNCKIDFSEEGSQQTVTLPSAAYTPSELCAAIKVRMEVLSLGHTYTVTFNSITRKFTIAQDGSTFSLLFATGPNAYISASGVLGYDIEDQTGALTYTSSYALSGIARLSKPISMYRTLNTNSQSARDSNKIFMIDDNTFQRDYPLGQNVLAIPDKFCVSEMSNDGLWTLRFNASVNEDTRAEVNYIPVARKLVDNVNSFPLIPGSFSDFLVYGAAHFIQADKSDTKATDSLQKAQAQLKALISFNRQGSQLAGNSFGKLVARPQGMKRQWGSGSAY